MRKKFRQKCGLFMQSKCLYIILLFYGKKKQTPTQVFSCGACETFKNSGGYFWKHVIYYYLWHKLVIFNAVLFTPLHLLLTRWWDMRLKHDVTWLWEEQADSWNVCQNKKKYCSRCITWMRIDTILSRISITIFKICFLGSCSSSWATKQIYFGNFTRPQTYFGHPKPSDEC